MTRAHSAGSFFGLRTGTKPAPNAYASAGAKMKPRASIPEHDIHTHTRILILQAIDDAAQAVLILQQRRDVVKKYPGFGEVGNFADQLFEMLIQKKA